MKPHTASAVCRHVTPVLTAFLVVAALPLLLLAASPAEASTLIQSGIDYTSENTLATPSPSGAWLVEASTSNGAQMIKRSHDNGTTWSGVAIDGLAAGKQFGWVAIGDQGQLYATANVACGNFGCQTDLYKYSTAWSGPTRVQGSGYDSPHAGPVVTSGTALIMIERDSRWVFRSADDGATWAKTDRLPIPTDGIRVAVLGEYVHVISGSYYARIGLSTGTISPSAGPVLRGAQYKNFVLSAPGDPTHLYIVGTSMPTAPGSGFGLYGSTDAGATWTTIVPNEPTPYYLRHASYLTSSGVGWAMGADGRIYAYGQSVTDTTAAQFNTVKTRTLQVASRGVSASPDWSPVTVVGDFTATSDITAHGVQARNGSVPSPMLTIARATASGGRELRAFQGTGDVVAEPQASTFNASGDLVTSTCGCSRFAASPLRSWQAAVSNVGGGESIIRSNNGVMWDRIPMPAMPVGRVASVAVSDSGEILVESSWNPLSPDQQYNYAISLYRFAQGRWYGPVTFSASGRNTLNDGPGPMISMGLQQVVIVESATGVVWSSLDGGNSWFWRGDVNDPLPGTTYPISSSTSGYVTESGHLDIVAPGDTGRMALYRYTLLTGQREKIESPNLPASNSVPTLLVRFDVAGELWVAAAKYPTGSGFSLHRSQDAGSSWSTIDANMTLPTGMPSTGVVFALGGDKRLYAFGAQPPVSGQVSIVSASRSLTDPAWSTVSQLGTVPSGAEALRVVAYGSSNGMPIPPDLWVGGYPEWMISGGRREGYHFGQVGGIPPGTSVSAGELLGGYNAMERCAACVGGQTNVGEPVDASTGNFWHTFDDLVVPGRGPALHLTQTYNSMAANVNGPLGWGWTHSYMMSLSIGAGAASVTVNQENAAQATFSLVGGTYVAAPRVTGTLVHNGDNTWTLVRDKRETFTFDAGGKLTEIKDLNGYKTTLAYTGTKLTTVTDPAQRTLTFAYNSYNGQLISKVTDTASPARSVSFDYDPATGNLTSMTDVGNGVTTFAYDGSHRLITMLDPNQQSSATKKYLTNTYDASGKVTSQKDFEGQTTLFDYTSIPGATKVTDPKLNVSVQYYTGGFPTALTRGYGTSSGATWKTYYDPATLMPAVLVDPRQKVTVNTYDPATARLLSTTDPLQHTTRYTYTALGDVETVTDANQVTTTLHYDAAGNLQWTSTPLTDQPGLNRVTTYHYDDAAHPGDVTSMVDPNNKTWTYTYNAAGDLATVRDPIRPVADVTTYCTDGVGRRLRTITPKGTAAGVTCSTANPANTYLYSPNAYGDVLTETDPLGHQTVRTYDANRNLKTVKEPGATAVTTYTYDRENRLVRTDRPDTTFLITDYWPDGSLKVQTDGAAHATNYAYDPLGHPTTVTDPRNKVTTYTSDALGNVRTKQDPGGNCSAAPKVGCTTYDYDDAYRLSAVTYSDGTPNVGPIGYDNVGRRTAMVDGTGSSSWAYDSLGRLKSTTDGANKTVGYTYDLAGNVRTIAYPTGVGSVTRHYDDAGRMDWVEDWMTNRTTFAYDADGFMTTQSYPAANGIVASYGPDAADRLMSVTQKKGATTLASFAYDRYDDDKLKSVTATGVPADTHSYSYTQLDQLKTTDGATSYGYDSADNLTTMTGGVSIGGYDAANRPATVTRGTGVSTLAYDDRGNRTSTSARTAGTTYAYDQANRLVSTDPVNSSTSMAVGWYHSLVARTDGTVWATGYNAHGQLGDGTTNTSSAPVKVTGLAGVVAVAANNEHSLALKSDGTVWAWGYNPWGQLGNNTYTDSAVPVQVQGVADIVAIAAGVGHNLALRSDGTVWAWGWGTNGELGNNQGTTTPTAVQVQGLTGVSTIAAGWGHSLAVRGDGTLWTWGYNPYGELGDNSNTNRWIPVQVMANVAGVAAGYFHTVALKADGSVWAWGFNDLGQLGNNTTTWSSVPVQVPGLTNGGTVGAGGYGSAVLKTDGTLATWGYNAYGSLGIGTTVDSHAPTAVTGLSGVKGLSVGAITTLVAKADGSVSGWGYNGLGALGDGTMATPVTTPKALPASARGTAPRSTYTYSGDGLRTAKTVAGTTKAFTWDRAQGIPLALGDGDRLYVYGPGGLPLEQIDAAGNVTYLHHDQLGSTRMLSNSSGAVVGTMTYDPFGSLTGSAGSTTTPLRYAGEYTDAETGFLYLRARYYDPGTGQFLSRDPLVALTGSAYGYVGGNPLNGTDPLGLKPIWQRIKSGLDVAAVVLSGSALIADMIPGGQLVGAVLGGASAAVSLSAAGLQCAAGGLNAECAKAAAIGLLSAATFGTSLAASKLLEKLPEAEKAARLGLQAVQYIVDAIGYLVSGATAQWGDLTGAIRFQTVAFATACL